MEEDTKGKAGNAAWLSLSAACLRFRWRMRSAGQAVARGSDPTHELLPLLCDRMFCMLLVVVLFLLTATVTVLRDGSSPGVWLQRLQQRPSPYAGDTALLCYSGLVTHSSTVKLQHSDADRAAAEKALIAHVKAVWKARGLQHVLVHGDSSGGGGRAMAGFLASLHAALPFTRISAAYHQQLPPTGPAPPVVTHQYDAALLAESFPVYSPAAAAAAAAAGAATGPGGSGASAGGPGAATQLLALNWRKGAGGGVEEHGPSLADRQLWRSPSFYPHLTAYKYSGSDGKLHVAIMAAPTARAGAAAAGTGGSLRGAGTSAAAESSGSDADADALEAAILAFCQRPDTVLHLPFLPPSLYNLHACAAELQVWTEPGWSPSDGGTLVSTVDLRQLLAQADVSLYVGPSTPDSTRRSGGVEPFPQFILDSLSVGTPCVITGGAGIATYSVDPVLASQLHLAQQPLLSSDGRMDAEALEVVLAVVEDVTDTLRAERYAFPLRLRGMAAWLANNARWHFEDSLDRTCSASSDSSDQRSALAPLEYRAWEPLPRPLPLSDKSQRLRIAFMTTELAPVTFGGAGTVISAMALELLSQGHSVVLIADFAQGLFDQWVRYAGEQLQLRAAEVWDRVASVHVPTITAAHADEAKESSVDYLQRSREFALAAKYAYEEHPFDTVECVDFYGLCYELLREQRVAATQAAVRGSRVTTGGSGRLQHWLAGGYVPLSDRVHGPATQPYLPSSVAIAVRLHGALELLDAAEGSASTAGSSSGSGWMSRLVGSRSSGVAESSSAAGGLPLYSLLERYCFAAAPLLYVQSAAMRDLYARAYGLDPGSSMVIAPPPLARMLDSWPPRDLLRQPQPSALLDLSWVREKDPLRKRLASLLKECPPPALAGGGGAALLPQRCKLLLMLGKLQPVKGTHTVTAALVHLFHRLQQEADAAAAAAAAVAAGAAGQHEAPPKVMVAFVGVDMQCADGSRRMLCSKWIERTLSSPAALAAAPLAAQRTRYLGPVSRDDLPRLLHLLQPHAGVIASTFETYNMAAHELSHFNIPLVLSAIPAFTEWFTNATSSSSTSSIDTATVDVNGPTTREAFMFHPEDAAACGRALYASLRDEAALARIRAAPPLDYPEPTAAYRYQPQRQTVAALQTRSLTLLEEQLEHVIREEDADL